MAQASICITGLFVRSYGIITYTRNLIIHLSSQSNAPKITLLIHRDIASHFSTLSEHCDIKVFRWRNALIKHVYRHMVFPIGPASRYDLVHCVGNSGLLFGKLKQVITIHDTYEITSPERFGPVKRFFLSRLVSTTGRRANAIITPSRSTAHDVARHYPDLFKKTHVIYHGVSHASPLPPLHAETKRPFLFVGTIEPGKNLESVLRALAMYRESARRSLHIVGAKGWRHSHLPRLINELGIGDYVHFLGALSDSELAREYSSAFALILASTYEGFGLPVIEAMSHGCPVIAAKNSGIIEAGGDAALFFNARSVEDLAEKMLLMESNRLLVRKMIRKGRKHVRSFDWNACAQKTLDLYLQVIAEKDRKPRNSSDTTTRLHDRGLSGRSKEYL